MIDTHAHIYDQAFDEDREELIKRAKKVGINQIYLPNIDSESIGPMLDTESRFPDMCKAMMGLHPNSVKDGYHIEIETVKKWLSKRDFIAIGEIGMDLYRNAEYRKEQEEALSIQLKLAVEYNLPVVIHTREAFPDIFKVVEKVYSEKLRGVFHSFTGTVEDARTILSMPGFYIGINGVVTFKNSTLKDTLLKIGYDRLLIETDAPYLAPVPYRGKRNEPAYLLNVVNYLSEIFTLPTSKLKQLTTNNAKSLFERRSV